jgi:cyanate lyase
MGARPPATATDTRFSGTRFYEVLQVYGPAIKELIHEKFGDGIMSAINFRIDAVAEPDDADRNRPRQQANRVARTCA